MFRSLLLLCGALLALIPLSAHTQALLSPPQPLPTETELRLAEIDSVAEVERIANGFRASGDLRRQAMALERLIQLRPQNAIYRYALAQSFGLQGERSRAYDTLLRLQRIGLSWDVDADPAFAAVNDTRAYRFIADALKQNGEPFGLSTLAYTLPAEDLLIESIAFDPVRQHLLVGSVRNGAVYRVAADGGLEPLIEASADNGLWGVYDIAVDPRSRTLWIASVAVPHFRGFQQRDAGRAGLFRFDLEAGELVEAHVLPVETGPHILSSLAIAPNGTVFVADGVRNIVYRLDGGALEPLFANVDGGSIRGMAVTPDNRYLIVADYEVGLFLVDLDAAAAYAIQAPEAVHIGGIDGVYLYGNTLVTIQNSVAPRRVMKFRLSPDGRSIVAAVPVVGAQPEMTMPTVGEVVGNELLFIANSQRGNYDQFGLLLRGKRPEPVKILRTALDRPMDEIMLQRPTMQELRRRVAQPEDDPEP